MANVKKRFRYRKPKLMKDGRIECEVEFIEGSVLVGKGWLPYTADPNDSDPASIGPEMHATMMGDKRLSMEYLAPEARRKQLADEVRKLRNDLIQGTDWTQLPDVPKNIREPATIYRKLLRDITAQPSFPENVIWPVRPAGI